MSSSTTLSLDNARVGERRSRRREALQGTVLVFFGSQNWGKLIDVNDDGMSFEFAHLPHLRQHITFTFQVMGSTPIALSGKGTDESFQAAGEILWTRAFERIAGARFVGLDETHRRQIHWLLSFRKPLEEPPADRKAEGGLQNEMAKPSESRTPYSETPRKAEVEAGSERRDLTAGPQAESGPQRATESPETPPLEDSRVSTPNKQGQSAWRAGSNIPSARNALVLVAGIAVTLVVSARMILSKDRSAEARGRIAGQIAIGESSGIVSSSSVETTRPLQMEVLDARGRRWVLWIVRDRAKNRVNPPVSDSVTPSRSFRVAPMNITPIEGAAAERKAAAFDYTGGSARPKISGPAQDPAPAEAPPISAELSVPGESSMPTSPKPPVPATPTILIRSTFQEARLRKSVTPEYPEFAKSAKISGAVVVDAEIDAAGNVRSVKVISGPPLLQRAAVDAVCQRKYEPARLDGQPIAVHLRLTQIFTSTSVALAAPSR
jgi:TonB family protein